MARRDTTVAALALGFGAVAAYESAKLPFGTVHSPGPGFFPWWTSVLIVALASIFFAQTLTTHARGEPESGRRITKVLALLAVLALYTFSLEPLGYPLCTFLLVLFMLRVTDPQRWPVALGMAALTAAGSYIVFAVWLSVPLPRGPL
ncbi:MAG TPA: tripartite tricarboxylate transporter TctB family protein [Candidatus Binatia bacterium]|nr:tripartite tricarboxylate transporter TctB family protein [Candidatus Binatia bacterium]